MFCYICNVLWWKILSSNTRNGVTTKGLVQQAVCQNGGLISSEILFNFAALALVRAAVKAATSASCKNVVCNQPSHYRKRTK
jgi:hypothetical protein